MSQEMRKVLLVGAGGLLGTHVLEAFRRTSFDISILSRNSSKSTFPDEIKVVTVDDDYPTDQLVRAFSGQDAVVSLIPGRPYAVHQRMIDAAVEAGVKRFIPSEYGNNTCAAASQLCPLYAEKARTMKHLKSKESAGLTWTAVHTGQFFDWGLGAGWFNFCLDNKKAIIYDSGKKRWSTTTIGTTAAAIVSVLQKPEETENRPVFVASFTVSQRQVLQVLEEVTGSKWTVEEVTSAKALEQAARFESEEYSEGLKLRILMLLYAEDADRGADFEKDGLLDNELLGLPQENLKLAVERVVKQL
ncbi:hypothetical protein S40285_07461 [Stachybotrys chlorohalonatus IBT 40285]|uniref:NmrA-like domain-containing protein n=1 Tax=Stachybotrys chlorohalonatus (strain IBT 40285) TaxID=1283841 RepID=A0A084R068_STAC4|nr:hypothetical protein S40285_07461 [Stachybotrys chlorohalonata IBT 40285]